MISARSEVKQVLKRKNETTSQDRQIGNKTKLIAPLHAPSTQS